MTLYRPVAIPERSIQADIMAYLRLNQWYVLRLNSGALPNAQGRPVHMLPAGTPDLLAIREGRALFVEVKRPGNRPTARQVAMMETLRAYGARCVVATSVEELRRALGDSGGHAESAPRTTSRSNRQVVADLLSSAG